MRPKVLLLEDTSADAELVQMELAQGGVDAEVRHVSALPAYLDSLESFAPDVILSDFNMPGFGGMEALEIRNRSAEDVPFIFVTGSLGEELAVSTLRSGATDFVLKDRMARLPAAVTAALNAAAQRRERARIDRELSSERNLMQAVLDVAQAMIVVLDRSGHIMHINAAGEKMLGSTAGDLSWKTFWDVIPGEEHRDAIREQLQAALAKDDGSSQSWSLSTRTERTIVCSTALLADNHRGAHLVVCGIDVTAQEDAEQRAFFLGHFDPLTKLSNRMHFLQQLDAYCSKRKPDLETVLVVVMIGLSRVQDIGDSYGESAINRVLIELVKRLSVWQSHADFLSRVADHSFALAFEAGRGPGLDMLVPHMLEQLREPVHVGDSRWVSPAAHAGLALFPDNANDAASLLQAAESALHCAVMDTHQSQHYAFYTPLLSEQIRERVQIESELREALKNNEQLVLHYQPQIDISTGRAIGLEALIRWNHPRLGWLSPARFIPQAELSDLILPLGRWVMRRACQQLRDWAAQGIMAPTVAINLSAGQFSAASMVRDVRMAMQEFGVTADQLELELTESTSMRDPESSIAIMGQLHDMGLKIAIDDFGTGYSNLSYLKRFPVDRIKLDQAFVRDIMTDPDDLAISRAIIAMAHQLRLEVVAEGVETDEQLNLLATAGCRTIQGYVFSRPVGPEVCGELLQRAFPIVGQA